MNIYIHKDGRRDGPFSSQQAGDLIRQGRYSLSDLAWHEGMADWQALHSIADIVEAVLPPEPKKAPEQPAQPLASQIQTPPSLQPSTSQPEQQIRADIKLCKKCGKPTGVLNRSIFHLFDKASGPDICSQCSQSQYEQSVESKRDQFFVTEALQNILENKGYAFLWLAVIAASFVFVIATPEIGAHSFTGLVFSGGLTALFFISGGLIICALFLAILAIIGKRKSSLFERVCKILWVGVSMLMFIVGLLGILGLFWKAIGYPKI